MGWSCEINGEKEHDVVTMIVIYAFDWDFSFSLLLEEGRRVDLLMSENTRFSNFITGIKISGFLGFVGFFLIP